MPAFNGAGPAQADFQNSSLLSADSYALLRSIVGGYVVFKDSSFIKGGILDFLYKMGNIKDTTTRDIWHYEKGSIIPVGICAGAVTDNGGGSFTFAVSTLGGGPGSGIGGTGAGSAQTNLAYSYNSAATVNQVPPGAGPTFSFGTIGEVLIARNGALRGVITNKITTPISTTITVQTGSVNTTSWSALQSGDRVNIVTRVNGERDPFHPGYSQTNTRFATTIQMLEASTPQLTSAALSQQRSYRIEGQEFVGPEYLEDLNTRYAMYEAMAMILGNGQQYVYSDTGNSETRTEILGILPAAQTLGFDWGTIAINATSLQDIGNYNFENEGGKNLAVFAGRAIQAAIGSYFRNPSNGFVNGGIKFDDVMSNNLKKINFDFDGWKIGGTNFMTATAVEFENPRITAGYTNATTKTTKFTNQAVCFPMGDDMATIDNPLLTDGTKVQSVPFGFNTYYEVPRDFNGPVGTGRMLLTDQTPANLNSKSYMKTMSATVIQQYIAGVKLQAFNI